MDPKILALKFGYDILQGIAVATRNPYDITLNGSLNFSFTVFDELNNLFCLLLRNTLLNLSSLSNRATDCRFYVAITQRFQWNTSPDEFLLENVVHVSQLRFVFCGQHQLMLFKDDICRTTLEVETLSHFLDGLI